MDAGRSRHRLSTPLLHSPCRPVGPPSVPLGGLPGPGGRRFRGVRALDSLGPGSFGPRGEHLGASSPAPGRLAETNVVLGERLNTKDATACENDALGPAPEQAPLRPVSGRHPTLEWCGNVYGGDPLAEKCTGASPALAGNVDALGQVTFHQSDRVQRHQARGVAMHDPRAERRAADDQALAGMRNPSKLVARWPRLWAAMQPVARVLAEERTRKSELQFLCGALGPSPLRQPPSAEAISVLRQRVAAVLQIPPGAEGDHHRASPWRFRIVAAIQDLAHDPDIHLRRWLEFGAPMGISQPIESSGGLFPEQASEAALSPDDVFDSEVLGNHPSFGGWEEERSPGYEVVTAHVDQGFGLLFESRHAAEQYVGSPIAPAPLGCISKRKDDGSTKHRVIMDLKTQFGQRCLRRSGAPGPSDRLSPCVGPGGAGGPTELRRGQRPPQPRPRLPGRIHGHPSTPVRTAF